MDLSALGKKAAENIEAKLGPKIDPRVQSVVACGACTENIDAPGMFGIPAHKCAMLNSLIFNPFEKLKNCPYK
jgi:hypothetical protein